LISHERQDRARPAIWDLDSGAVTEVEIDLPGEVSASWYPDSAALLVIHRWRGRSELYRLAVAGGQIERLNTPAGVIPRA
jgi:hypothetical protein